MTSLLATKSTIPFLKLNDLDLQYKHLEKIKSSPLPKSMVYTCLYYVYVYVHFKIYSVGKQNNNLKQTEDYHRNIMEYNNDYD